MREAAEPEERAAEEKPVESKSEERKEEKMGSAEKESRAETAGDSGVGLVVCGVGVAVAVALVVPDGGLSLKVESR